MHAARNLVEAHVIHPKEAALKPEKFYRPLSKLDPELQAMTYELIKRLQVKPDTKLVNHVVSEIRAAIATGWRERTGAQTGKNGSDGRPARNSDQLAAFSRWANKLSSVDPTAIAAGDDEVRAQQHLVPAKALIAFASRLIIALENRMEKSSSCSERSALGLKRLQKK
jgi:hypothetical protein